MKELFGSILLAVGILIAGASGVCSFAVLLAGGGDFRMIPLVLVVGGLPIALGILIALGGRTMIRNAREERSSDRDVADIFE